jgi:hypothetical protein
MPPPPPPYPATKQQGLAAASLIVGIASITLGLCCYFGILSGPIAVVLGIIALVQIKNDPTKYAGKGMAIGGIVTGGLGLALLILFFAAGVLSGVMR